MNEQLNSFYEYVMEYFVLNDITIDILKVKQ